MLWFGLKKSLLSPRCELMAQSMAQHTHDQSQVWYHSAIQAPQGLFIFISDISGKCGSRIQTQDFKIIFA